MIKNIIFDRSGTLSNDIRPVHEATCIVFRELGKEPISIEEFKREFTLPYMNFWNKYFPDLTKKKQDRLFLEAIHKVSEPEPFPGIEVLLEKLYNKKINMVIFSSHPQKKLDKEMLDNNFTQYFKEILGSTHDKTKCIMKVLKRNNFKRNETLYVGDMVHDIKTSKKAGIKILAVSWGYDSKEKLSQANPDYLIENLDELNNILFKLV
ncbi:HAD family hydrolase [archaeon]|jgi:phosphoglycolate phosphatase|nr:HAD family hydrolase [archaeon]MBT3450869.1 HAD family hydrolase [archaeon]MBT6869051.1 HAD family hydrolase [archaeon]MBT7193294.1 HAD family hydrolase [archaeon]MBT7380302.1 HAD family hydrolase [archaeon]